MSHIFSLINNIGPWELIFFFICLLSVVVFILPTLIAFKKDKNNKWPVLIVNLLLGWFIFGWVIALVMALMNSPEKNYQANSQEIGVQNQRQTNHQGALIYSSETKNNRIPIAISIIIILSSIAVFMLAYGSFSDPSYFEILNVSNGRLL